MNDDYGDETELEIIIEAGQREAEDFGTEVLSPRSVGGIRLVRFCPAKWLNPPHKVMMAADYD